MVGVHALLPQHYIASFTIGDPVSLAAGVFALTTNCLANIRGLVGALANHHKHLLERLRSHTRTRLIVGIPVISSH